MTQTITTAEELDALPWATTVMDGDFDIMTKGEDGEWHQLAEQDEPSPCYLPATVLYRPGQPTEPARCAPSREEIVRIWEDSVGDSGDAPSDDELVEFARALLARQRTEAEVKAEAWDEGAEYMDSDVFWHDGGRESNPYRTARPAPDLFAAMGLPSVEVPSVGGGQHG